MATEQRRRFIHGQTAWMASALLVLTVLDAFTYELFFVTSLIGFLVLIELTAPFHVTPRWRARLKWIILAGLLVFGYVVVRRILAILPPGIA